MKSNRIGIAILVLVALLLLGLGGLYVWLTGGAPASQKGKGRPAAEGLIHVRTIYTANGESLFKPVGIGADGDGGFYITLRDKQRVIEFDRQGDWIRSWGERGLGQGQMMAPVGIAVDRAADHVYVTDRSRLRLIAYSTEGRFQWEVAILNPLTPSVRKDGLAVTTFGPIALLSKEGEFLEEVGSRGPEKGQFDYARGIAPVGENEAIIADSNNTRVQRVQLSGEPTASVVWVDGRPPYFQDDPDTKYGVPSSVALDGKGRAFVLDGFRHSIVVLDAESGKRLHAFTDLEGAEDGRFRLPTGIAYLGGDHFAITDTYNDRVQIVRLLLPGENNVVSRNPWVIRLLPLLALLLLPPLLGRKRWYATTSALETADARSELRLLAALGGRLHVVPEDVDRFGDVVERDVRLGDYLVAVGEPGEPDAAQRLITAATPDGWKRLLLPRIRVIVLDEAEREHLSEFGRKRLITLAEIEQDYAIEDSASSGAANE